MRDIEINDASARSRLELRVRFCETDLMGIVHHGNYLSYFEAGRVEWLRKRGVTGAKALRHEAGERSSERLGRRTVEQTFGHRIEHDDTLVFVDRDDRFHRRPDDAEQSCFAKR